MLLCSSALANFAPCDGCCEPAASTELTSQANKAMTIHRTIETTQGNSFFMLASSLFWGSSLITRFFLHPSGLPITVIPRKPYTMRGSGGVANVTRWAERHPIARLSHHG